MKDSIIGARGPVTRWPLLSEEKGGEHQGDGRDEGLSRSHVATVYGGGGQQMAHPLIPTCMQPAAKTARALTSALSHNTASVACSVVTEPSST